MKVTTSDKFTTLTAENNFATFSTELQNTFSEYSDKNLVLNLSDITVSENEINNLETYAEQQAENGQSFVVVFPSYNPDAFEEEFNVVPTLVEAEDIIDMDAMERELGF